MVTFDDCATSACDEDDACHGKYRAKFDYDPGNCERYGNVRLEIETDTEAADGKYAEESTCASGSGGFFLHPLWKFDRDGDGKITSIYLPVQLSGTGTMTPRSWVTSATLNDAPTGTTIRLVEHGRTIKIGQDDLLSGGYTDTHALSGTHTFSSGEVGGMPYILIEEAAGDEIIDGDIDLDWTCHTGGSAVTDAQGWSFSLADIGCPGVKQKLTLRYKTSPNRVELELYGRKDYQVTEPTNTTAAGQAFVFDRWGLELDATLTAWDSNSATVQIDQVDLDGIGVCATGTYTFASE